MSGKGCLVTGGVVVLLVVCVATVCFFSVPPEGLGAELSLGDILEGLLAIAGAGVVCVLVAAWILGGCSLG